MTTDWDQWLVHTVDYGLGWLLDLPRDVSLVLFALGTALLMVRVRYAITNQDLLGRCAADLRVLKQRIRQARSRNDKPDIQRIQTTVGMVRQMQLMTDLRLLAAVILPIAALAIWATARFDSFPLRVGEEFTLRARYSIASQGRVTHLVPDPHVELLTPVIQVVQVDIADKQHPQAYAEWKLRALKPTTDVALNIRHHGETAIHHISIGQRTYLPMIQLPKTDAIILTEATLRPYKPLGMLGPISWLPLPPWMIAYLVLTMLFVPALKRLMKVA